MSRNYLFTSESTTEGHPDKVADQISDAVLDAIMSEDPMGRVACETLVTTGLALVTGEITTRANHVDISSLARNVIRDIGYIDASYGFDCDHCALLTAIDEQSPDIAMGVDRRGAGDQGMMFGYACNETPELMPMPITLAHKLTRRLAEARKEGILEFLRPDGKSQVTVEYLNGEPVNVDTVVISTQHHPDVPDGVLKEGVVEEIIKHVIPDNLRGANIKYHINPTGRFVVGGAAGRFGLNREKDHCRYVRWDGQTRWRRLFWQRSDKGRSKRMLRCSTCGKEHCCRETRRSM